MAKRNKAPPSKADRQRNPKAFAFSGTGKAHKSGQRNSEKLEKRLHVPLMDRSVLEPPPVIVAVVGPAKSGKTTLIQGLVKRYTRQKLNEIRGPVTVVSGKRQRLTFIECNNDINSMIDIAKIADLVLMTVDASFGFEMETFEFLNILQSHGFPRIMGVLTHLDSPKFKVNNGGAKKLRKTKKLLKHRFWTEIYQGAKLFYLSGLINGSYPKTEIMNLSRFISVMKFRPLIWRNSHPYMLADRFEDLTPEDAVHQSKGTCDRTVALYGYLHGTNLKKDHKVHIPGVGDRSIADISLLSDPCEMPDQDPEKKRKRLDDKQKMIYAPMSDTGGLLYDKDAVYISVPGNFSKSADIDEDGAQAIEEAQPEGVEMVTQLQDAEETLAEKMKSSTVRLFPRSKPLCEVHESEGRERRKVIFDNPDEDLASEDDNDDEDMIDGEEGPVGRDDDSAVESGNVSFADSDSDIELEDHAPKWKSSLVENARRSHSAGKKVDLMEYIYGDKPVEDNGDEEDEQDDSLFKLVKRKKEETDVIGPARGDSKALEKWDDEATLDDIRHRFITGELEESENDEQGDFEDLEEEDQQVDGEKDGKAKDLQELEAKKKQLKRKFDAEYDDEDDEETKESTLYDEVKSEMARQMEANRAEFSDLDPERRALFTGYQAGEYVRILIHEFPAEFVANFDPSYPIILGGLLSNEAGTGFVQTRIKKHRWFEKILKNNDPLVVSLGWRRFQTLPVYSMNDGTRNRMLKYTPEHMHCLGSFFGPITPPRTGFCCFQSVSGKKSNFRVCATGVTLENDQTVTIVKKLKLTGTPCKILKNTAYIKDMFHSSLEVAKFVGASIRTVSGIRGQIKKPHGSPEGSFRATFEDKILMSDIVFLRTWYPVQVRKYMNPVTNLLLASDNRQWSGMRLVRDLRKEANVAIPNTADSNYRSIEERPEKRVFRSFKVPSNLQGQLPFKSKPKEVQKKKKGYMEKRAVLLEPEEKKIFNIMQDILTVKNEKAAKKKAKTEKSRAEYQKKVAKEDAIRAHKDKERKKAEYKKLGLAEGKNKGAVPPANKKHKARK